MTPNLIGVIKQSYTVEMVLEKYVGIDLSSVKQRNKSFNICCPFHQDRSPSFTIWKETNYWKCWAGCGEGDQINLVGKALNLKNKEAIKFLSKQLSLNKQQDIYMQHHGREETLLDKRLLKNFNNRISKTFFDLIDLRIKTKNHIQGVSTEDELESEYIVQLHHLVPKIEGWLESLESSNYKRQYYTLIEVQNFFRKGLVLWIKTK